MSYLEKVEDVYKEAALNPQKGLCCTTTPIWQLPGLNIPQKMLEMNYGCGSTVHPRDLSNNPTVLYVGIGGGMELLQFSYFARKNYSVIGVDPVEEMIAACKENLIEAEKQNDWFRNDFTKFYKGSALQLPLENDSVGVAAQNCLFNIFHEDELQQALKEIYRTLKPNSRLILSDPVCETDIPKELKNDAGLRALCLSGALTLNRYLDLITSTGFGTIEVRAKRPYRILDPAHYKTNKNIFIESVEICAIKDPIPIDCACIFTGKTAIFFGSEELFDDKKGHILVNNQPIAICDKTAKAITELNRKDIFISESTFFYDGGGCC